MAQLVATPTQRVHLGAGPRAGFRQKTFTHVPGSVVRGAYAAAWIARHDGAVPAAHRAEFTALFEGSVVFGPLHAGRLPTPLSLRVHKYPASPQCPQRFWDEADPAQHPPTRCPHCGSPLQRAKPGDDPVRTDPPSHGPGAPRTRTRTHVTIGADGVAVDRELFQRVELDPRTVSHLSGHVHGRPEHLALLRSFPTVRVGGRRTSSGQMTLSWTDLAWTPPTTTEGTRLVLRLIAPGIFVDDRGAPRPEPSPAELTRILDTPAHVERRWFRWTEIGGWHAASGLPKHTDRAVEAGSTYVVRAATLLDTAVLTRLATGIGLRRHEGFGAVGGADADPSRWQS